MANQRKPQPNQAVDQDNLIVETNAYLQLQEEHKDWYDRTDMGKQHGRPKMVKREEKKPVGRIKHNTRKEK